MWQPCLVPIQQPVGQLAVSPACMHDMPLIVGNWEIVSISRYLDDLLVWVRHVQTGQTGYVIVPDAPVHLLHNLRSLFC